MKHRMHMKLAVCVLLVFALPSLYAQMPQPFSADMTTSMSNGQKMTGKWYFSPPKMRMDMTSMPESHGQSPFGGNMSMIIDGTTQTSYMLMPQQQMYMEFKGSSRPHESRRAQPSGPGFRQRHVRGIGGCDLQKAGHRGCEWPELRQVGENGCERKKHYLDRPEASFSHPSPGSQGHDHGFYQRKRRRAGCFPIQSARGIQAIRSFCFWWQAA
jgi:Domain of unknown function (DUF4412)